MNTIIAPVVASPLDAHRGRGVVKKPSPCPCKSKECREAYEADIKRFNT